MTDTTSYGVVGSLDNVMPLFDPNRGFRTWAMFEIFDGTIGTNRFVPNVHDRVLDTDTDIYWKVTAVDPVTFLSTLVKVTGPFSDGTLSQDDILLGVGPGPQSSVFRAYLNDKVLPYDMAVDQRCFVWYSRAKYARVFRGGYAGAASRIVSAVYDTAGNLIGQDVPLELAEVTGNKTRYTLMPFKCTEKIPNGEPLYVAFYSADNVLLSKQQVLTENTDFISLPLTGAKYVTDFYLDTPFLSTTDSTLLQYPINVLMQGLNLMGVVKYSDGTTARYPVDGTKFALFGLQDYVATVVGDEVKVVLVYNLAADEIAYGLATSENRTTSKTYRAQTLTANGSYSVKLFAYPVWRDAINGYRLEWFLANLERTNIWLCTANVRINEGGVAFDPLLLNTNQRLVVSVDLQAVNASFNAYKHVQTIDVTLLRPGTEHDTNWQIGFEPGQNPPYGVQNYATSTFVDVNDWRIKIDMGATVFSDWLDRLFYRTLPLYDPQKETAAPAPTHFAFDFTNTSIEFPINEWNLEHVINQAVPDGGTLFVRFFKRTADNDIQLAMAGIPIRQNS